MNPWPPIVTMVLFCLNLGVAFAKHGKPQRPYNAWYTVISFIIMVGLLAWGGFWRPLFGG